MRLAALVTMAATAVALVPPNAPRRPLTPVNGFFDNAFKNESFDNKPKGGGAPAKKTVPVTIGSRTVQALPNQRLKDVVPIDPRVSVLLNAIVKGLVGMRDFVKRSLRKEVKEADIKRNRAILNVRRKIMLPCLRAWCDLMRLYDDIKNTSDMDLAHAATQDDVTVQLHDLLAQQNHRFDSLHV